MPSDSSANVRHERSATIVHAINSQLLELLFGEKAGLLNRLLVERTAWIINILYLHGRGTSVPVLKTSSTLHGGLIFDHSKERGAVQSIDENVPIATSVCGRCIQSGRPIWLGRKDLGLRPGGFTERYYRRFSLVAVDTAGNPTPRAEIAFPIASHHLNVVAVRGVLNLELFGEDPIDPDVYFAELPTEAINELFDDLLSLHSGFLKVAVDFLDLYSAPVWNENLREIETSTVDAVKAAHRDALQMFRKKNIRVVQHLLRAVRQSVARARSDWTVNE